MDKQVFTDYINALDMSEGAKKQIIEQVTRAEAKTTAGQQDANLAGLRGIGGVSGFIPGDDKGVSLAPEVIAKAKLYVPTTPTDNDNPLSWAYENYVKAGMVHAGPGVPNDAVSRFGPMLAVMGNQKPEGWPAAFKAVIDGYADGSVEINKGPTPAEIAKQWEDARQQMGSNQKPAEPAPVVQPPVVDNPPVIGEG